MLVQYKNENKACWGSKREITGWITHWHEFYEIEFLLEGTANETINGDLYRIKEGYITLLSPNDFHYIETANNKPLKYAVCCIRKEDVPKALKQKLEANKPPYLLKMSENNIQKLKYLFDAFFDEISTSKDSLTAKFLVLSIMSICIDLASQNILPDCDKLDEKFKNVKLILQYVNQHCTEKLTRDKIAEEFNYSPNYLSRLFKKNIGVSLSQYIINLRMEKAMELLHTSSLCVGEIISTVGYSSPSLFYKHFYDSFKTIPKQEKG